MTIAQSDLLSLKNTVESTLMNFLHVSNDMDMRRRIVLELSAIMMHAKMMGYVLDYKVVCDETNNAKHDPIFDLSIHVDIYIKPPRSINVDVWHFAVNPYAGGITPSWFDYEERRVRLLELCGTEL
jgi:hypothetical protein